jgi:ATP-dependent helicase HrpB
VLFRDLPLETRRIEPPPEEAAARLLADAVRAGDIELPRWDASVEQWVLRVNLLADACPELGLPAIGEEGRRRALERICLGAYSAKDLRERPAAPAVHALVPPALRPSIERHAPAEVALPGGARAKVAYAAGRPPRISKRIQELYDLRETPRIAMGRVALVVEILGPNHRPVQTTQDLAGFWREHYPRVKRELQRKYPKHEWR